MLVLTLNSVASDWSLFIAYEIAMNRQLTLPEVCTGTYSVLGPNKFEAMVSGSIEF